MSPLTYIVMSVFLIHTERSLGMPVSATIGISRDTFMPFSVDDYEEEVTQEKKSEGDSVSSADAVEFMKTFGYLESGPADSETLYSKDAIEEAIKNVQRYGGLKETGELNEETKKLLNSPRCGNKDIEPSVIRRQKRYVIGSNGWRKRKIRYHLSNWTSKLGNQSNIIEDLNRAFKAWSDYSTLKFVRTEYPSKADIIVYFGRYGHGDSHPFDGPGFVLAHAFYPYDFGTFGGDIHFDEDEDWTRNLGNVGTDFFTVAVHEIGHSLGLSHSPIQNSIMFPYYKGAEGKDFTIGYDDILAMYELYVQRSLENNLEETLDGDVEDDKLQRETKPSTTSMTPISSGTATEFDIVTSPATTPTTTSTTSNFAPTDYQDDLPFGAEEDDDIIEVGQGSVCNGIFDSFTHIRGELFVFKGKNMWRFSSRGRLESGYPVLFHQMFNSLPKEVKKIDAVYERQDSRFMFFSGKQFWVLDGLDVVENSPRPLTDLGLPAYLEKIDAGFVWGKNGKAYIFSEDRYWKLDEDTGKVEPGYPLSVSERWRGIPDNIDAVFTWENGETFFFKANAFWRFDDASVIADLRHEIPVSKYWFGCT